MSTAEEKAELYALDLSGVEWLRPEGSENEEAVEIAYLPGGAVAMRNSLEPDGTVLRYTAAEWDAFVKGVRDGEFDL